MNTKQAKDFFVQEATKQAALDNVSLSDIEKGMMYFTESDPASCDDPLEVNDAFEAQYDTSEYETKVSRLIPSRLRQIEGGRPRRKAYLGPSGWGTSQGRPLLSRFVGYQTTQRASDTRFFKLLGISLLVAVGIGIAAVLTAKYNIDLQRYWKYAAIVIIGLVLLSTGLFRLLYRLAFVWFHRRSSDFITMSAPSTRVDCGCITTKGSGGRSRT